jgi:hypothetical protein
MLCIGGILESILGEGTKYSDWECCGFCHPLKQMSRCYLTIPYDCFPPHSSQFIGHKKSSFSKRTVFDTSRNYCRLFPHLWQNCKFVYVKNTKMAPWFGFYVKFPSACRHFCHYYPNGGYLEFADPKLSADYQFSWRYSLTNAQLYPFPQHLQIQKIKDTRITYTINTS